MHIDWACQELSCLPLAVIQAGAYISKFDCLHQYLSIYRQNHATLLSQHPAQSHDDYRRIVYPTRQISFSQLSKVAARFLQLCSVLDHNDIPEAIFQQAAARIISPIQALEISLMYLGFMAIVVHALWDLELLRFTLIFTSKMSEIHPQMT